MSRTRTTIEIQDKFYWDKFKQMIPRGVTISDMIFNLIRIHVDDHVGEHTIELFNMHHSESINALNHRVLDIERKLKHLSGEDDDDMPRIGEFDDD